MNNWEVFQTDMLDVFRQYRGYFDFFERVGSLEDSRPDCFARITRDDKKEVWIVDAKNKSEISEEDLERMEKYVQMVKSNPVDVGLELGELSNHEIRGIFVTRKSAGSPGDYETVSFPRLHQFLQKQLIYSDTGKLIRDISKMMERRQLSQSEARMLFNAIKPYEQRLEQGLEALEHLETEYIGLELERPPIETYDYVPIDAVARHTERDHVFLFDIPYSRDALESVDEKVEEVRKRTDDKDKVYYAAINFFQESSSEYTVSPENLGKEISRAAGILSAEKILDLFQPKIPVEKHVGEGFIEIRSGHTNFRARVETSNDIDFKVEAVMPEKTAQEVQNHFLNSRKLGEIEGRRLRIDLSVTEEMKIDLGDKEETLESFRDAIRNLYSSTVNPGLSTKVNRAVSEN